MGNFKITYFEEHLQTNSSGLYVYNVYKGIAHKAWKIGQDVRDYVTNTSHITQQTSTCSHSTIETAEKGVKYVQS